MLAQLVENAVLAYVGRGLMLIPLSWKQNTFFYTF